MSHVLPVSLVAGPPIKLGYEEYLVLPDDGRRHEIVDGAHHVSPAPRPWHQTVSRRLQFALYSQLELTGRGQVFDAPIDVILGPHDIVQPDLVYLTAEQAALVTDRAIEGAPALVVEILSASTRRHDVLVKAPLYLRHGVGRYWIVDPDLDRVEGFVNRGAAWEQEFEVSAPSTLAALGASVDLAAVFAR
jgi:Uma2 family endonuclease